MKISVTPSLVFLVASLACIPVLSAQNFYLYGSESATAPTGFFDSIGSYNTSTLFLEENTEAEFVQSNQDSTFNMNDGNVGSASSWGNSTFNMRGGSTGGASSNDDSTFNMSGGVANNLYSKDYSVFNMSDGFAENVFSYENSIFNISGGIVYSAVAIQSSNINMTGGSVNVSVTTNGSSKFHFRGGKLDGNDLLANDASEIFLYGKDFGQYNAYAGSTLTNEDFLTPFNNIIELTFADDSRIGFDFRPNKEGDTFWTGSLHLIVVPETSTLLAGVLGLGVVIFLGKRRRAGQTAA